MLTYKEALNYILKLANYETSVDTAAAAARFNLDTVGRLAVLARWEAGEYIHIAGTKGKGSTAAMVEAILRAAGFRVGLFTSPHLHDFRERIRLSGQLITEERVAALTSRLRPMVRKLEKENPGLCPVTTFDFLTVMALVYFAQEGTDFAVLEAGLGGRLDATNVVTPLVTVMTSISRDHTQILGDTVEEIAWEKAGIIKPKGIVVSAPQVPEALVVLQKAAEDRGARFFLVGKEWQWTVRNRRLEVRGPFGIYDDLTVPLLGAHQMENAALAVAAVDALRWHGTTVPAVAIRTGLSGVVWPARLEILGRRPLVVADGAHNGDSARRLLSALRENFAFKRLLLILGTSSDKDIAGIAQALAPAAQMVILTRSQHPRAAPPALMESEVRRYSDRVHFADSVAAALTFARAKAGFSDLVCVTGSLFVAAEAREAVGLKTIYQGYQGVRSNHSPAL